MPVKPSHPDLAAGPINHGRGLDSLVGFIIKKLAPPTRFGNWSKHVGALSAPKVSLGHFLNDSLQAGWVIDGCGAVIPIEPPQDSFVTIWVGSENKCWTPETKYNPKRSSWGVVPVERVIGNLEAAMKLPLVEAVGRLLSDLRDGMLKATLEVSHAIHR